MSTDKTPRQRTRQMERRKGRYTEYCKCDRCRKPIADERYNQTSDDPVLRAAAEAAGLPGVGVLCHPCIKILIP